MTSDFEGSSDSHERWARVGNAGMGLVRITLLFGSAAIALALILTPLLERRTHDAMVGAIGVDRTVTTGSVPGGGSHVFTVRRSILHPGPDSVCIIQENGARSGAC